MNGSLRRKLIVMGTATSAAALAVTCGVFLAYDAASLRRSAGQELAGLAEVVARQCTAAVAFNDPRAAEEILRALGAKEDIVRARLELPDGRAFAEHAPGGRGPVRSEVSYTLVEDGVPVARAVVSSDLSHERRRLGRLLSVGAGAMAGALLLSFLLMTRLERTVTRPILGLARTIKSVTETRDYGVRAERTSRDEIGLLIDGVNDMLAQIQARDEALRLARDRLEERVQERTSELQRANAALEAQARQRRRGEEALRESENRYRLLFESSPDAILILSTEAVSLVNPAAARLFGVPSAAALVGGRPDDRIHPQARPKLAARLQEARKGWAVGPSEDLWLRADGTSFDGESIVIPFVDRGAPVFQLVLRDITRRKEADRLKNEFVSTVSHELRTPLTALRGALALLGSGRLGPLPGPAIPFLDIANADCMRLIRIINDLLDMQKIEAGRMEFRMTRVEVMPLVRRALETSRPFAEQNGVSLACVAGVEEAGVTGDGDRLLQVLGNLLSNAVKFSPRGAGVEVAVARRRGGVRVSVRDRGPGIPASFRERVFEPFAQADGSDSRQRGGTGLGLRICREIVERHGGSIGFDTAPGLGTTFHVDLPEAGGHGIAGSAAKRTPDARGTSLAPTNIVDDLEGEPA